MDTKASPLSIKAYGRSFSSFEQANAYGAKISALSRDLYAIAQGRYVNPIRLLALAQETTNADLAAAAKEVPALSSFSLADIAKAASNVSAYDRKRYAEYTSSNASVVKVEHLGATVPVVQKEKPMSLFGDIGSALGTLTKTTGDVAAGVKNVVDTINTVQAVKELATTGKVKPKVASPTGGIFGQTMGGPSAAPSAVSGPALGVSGSQALADAIRPGAVPGGPATRVAVAAGGAAMRYLTGRSKARYPSAGAVYRDELAGVIGDDTPVGFGWPAGTNLEDIREQTVAPGFWARRIGPGVAVPARPIPKGVQVPLVDNDGDIEGWVRASIPIPKRCIIVYPHADSGLQASMFGGRIRGYVRVRDFEGSDFEGWGAVVTGPKKHRKCGLERAIRDFDRNKKKVQKAKTMVNRLLPTRRR